MNKALDLLREIRPSIPKEVLELWCKDRDAFLASHPAVEQADASSCQGTNCGTTTGDHSSECLAEAAAGQGWELKPGDLCGRDCPIHKISVEQAGGDERAAFELFVRKHCDMPAHIAVNWDAKFTNDAWEGWQARAALAQPSPVRSSLLINGYQLRAALYFIAPDGTAEQLESEACIEWRQQDADFLEAGLYAFCAEYPEEGGVLLDEEPTNSQPSPAQELAERGTQHRFSTTEQTCRHDFAGVWWNDNGETKTGKECRECGFFIADIAEAPELERPEVVGYLATAEHPKHGQPHKAFNYFKDQHDAQVAHWRERGCEVSEDELMTVTQHERIVGALRSEIAEWQEAAGRSRSDVVAYIAERAKLLEERDAAQARVAGLEAELETERMRLAACGTAALGYFDGCADAYKSASLSDVLRLRGDCDAALARVAEFEAQAQHSVPVVTPEMVMAAMAVFRLDVSPFKSMEAALIAALRKAAAPGKEGV
ncbi:hypothetical protein H2N66_31090 [Pseudomonas aeruginosa]|nr:hypothetical protein [Pseudomonas aeruginosa]MBA5058319.1 hypothetical protein [Pseudomonas aeruginosa]